MRFRLLDGGYEEPARGWSAVERDCIDDLKNQTATFSIDAREFSVRRRPGHSSMRALCVQVDGLFLRTSAGPDHVLSPLAQAPSALGRWCA